MALATEILAITKKLSATKMRRGSAFIISDEQGAGAAAATLGRIKNTTVGMEAVLSEADSGGRQSVMGYNITVTITMMQTDGEALEAAFAAAIPAGTEDGQNGFNVLLTDKPTSEADAVALWPTLTLAQGIGFTRAILQVNPNLNYSGGESDITITITGTIDADTARAVVDTAKIDFDAA